MLEMACDRHRMARPFTRQQALENQAFLKALAKSGNIRLAARETGLKYGTVQHRRQHHPVFAQRIGAALALAEARLTRPAAASGPQHGAARPRGKRAARKAASRSSSGGAMASSSCAPRNRAN